MTNTAVPENGAHRAAPSPIQRLPFSILALVFIRERGIIVLWLLLLVFFTFWCWPYFSTVSNGLLILQAASLTAVFALGVALGVISGALDLSVPEIGRAHV